MRWHLSPANTILLALVASARDVTATYRDGILRIVIPKAGAEKSLDRQVAIE